MDIALVAWGGELMTLNILVCSDNHQIVESLASIAHRDGCWFMACHQGGEAILTLMVFKFDILILDLDTFGLDSLLFLSIARRMDPQLPIMAVSHRPALHGREIRQKGVFYQPVNHASDDEMGQVMRSWIEYAKIVRIGGEAPPLIAIAGKEGDGDHRGV